MDDADARHQNHAAGHFTLSDRTENNLTCRSEARRTYDNRKSKTPVAAHVTAKALESGMISLTVLRTLNPSITHTHEN